MMKRFTKFILFLLLFVGGTIAIPFVFGSYDNMFTLIALFIFWGSLLYYVLYTKGMIKNRLIKNAIFFVYLFIMGTASIIVFIDTFYYDWSDLTLVAIFLFWGILLYCLTRDRKPSRPMNKHSVSALKPISDERRAYYHEHGLSDEDIQFFRETMNTAKEQIIKADQHFSASSKLKAIRNRTSVIQICQNLFKEIVKAPDRLSEADQFLYVHLPSLEKLTNKYCQISQHQKKARDTYTVLDQSVQTIEKICTAIIEDYLRFMEADVRKLSDEVELAHRQLDKDEHT